MASTLPSSMQTYQDTIGIQEIGRRLAEMNIERVKAVEMPSPYYPLYYILDRAPRHIARQFSRGQDPYKLSANLKKLELLECNEWIESSGIRPDFVLNLHDNTKHPGVWPYQQERFLNEKRAYITRDGFTAAREDCQIEVGFYSDASLLRSLRETMETFSPRTKLDYKIDCFDDPKDWGSMTLSDTEVVVEYYPVRIISWPNKLQRMSVSNGLRFTSNLISFLGNYSL